METSLHKIAVSGKDIFFSVDIADFLIIMVAIFFGLIILHGVANHVPQKYTGNIRRLSKTYRTMVMILFYVLIFVVVLNGIVNKQYSNLFVLIFLLLAPKLGRWYTAYDRYVEHHV